MKKVCFPNKERDLCTIHFMYAWSFAYRAARMGEWGRCAIDRERFNRRIKDTEQTIMYCFKEEHRKKMYAIIYLQK